MRTLDPSWLRVELDAIEKEQQHWEKALRDSYEVAVQRVFEFQDRTRILLGEDPAGKNSPRS